MADIRRFRTELRLIGAASLLYVCVQGILLATSPTLRNSVVEKPGRIGRNVTTLGGPCMAVKDDAFARGGPLGIGKCWVHYTNAAKTTAGVTLHILRGSRWISVTADVVTDGGPLASLNWRVIRSKEIPFYGPGLA